MSGQLLHADQGTGRAASRRRPGARAFDVVNANGDAYVCYKQYPNPPHHGGHHGNVTDNTANPAQQLG